jgi:hypothetical protein
MDVGGVVAWQNLHVHVRLAAVSSLRRDRYVACARVRAR